MNNNVLDPALTTSKVAEFERELSELEAARASQLDSIDTSPDEVSTAYRETVSRLLEEIKNARRRISDGDYGTCSRCQTGIPIERLEWRPWATSCTSCATR